MKKSPRFKRRFILSLPKGFTFVEVLVVITIIAVLATVGTSSYSTLTKNSRDSRRKADLEEIRAALEMYKSNNGEYPDSIVSGNIIGDTSPNVYLQKVPDDPGGSSAHPYNFTRTATGYELGAYLENGVGTSTTCLYYCGSDKCNYCLTPYGQKK